MVRPMFFFPSSIRSSIGSFAPRNTASTASALLSARFDLSHADAVPDALLNEVIWKAVKGENSPVPAPRRSAFVKVSPEKDDD